ncbi:MAG: hypothetical protein IJ882_00245, partial [Paludibacteraceae bacterium]|nr:hypothetical protein [Paludibacteraceae bacterium]
QTMLLQNVLAVKQVFAEDEVRSLNEQDYSIIRRIEHHAAAIIEKVENMTTARHKATTRVRQNVTRPSLITTMSCPLWPQSAST